MAAPVITWGPPSPERGTMSAPVATWPAGAATDELFLFAISKGTTANISTPSGWSVAVPQTTVGTMRIAVFQRTAGGTASGTVTLSIPSADSTAAFVGRAPEGTEIISFVTAIDSTNNTNLSATASSALTLAVDDRLVAVTAFTNDATAMTATLSVSGATLGSTEVGVLNNVLDGSDMYASSHSAVVTAGGNATPSIAGSWTSPGNGTAVVVFLDFRGTPVVVEPPSTPTGLSVTPGSTTAQVSWNPVSGATSYDVEWVVVAAVPSGSASGALSFTGAAQGKIVRTGTSESSWQYSGQAVGETTRAGTASGSWQYSGQAVGETTRAGTASGSWQYSGQAVGKTARAGVASGSWQYSGEATAGGVDYSGIASGSWQYSGQAFGEVDYSGIASGSWTYSGVVIGGHASEGIASGAITWTGEAQGEISPTGFAVGTWSYVDIATGVTNSNLAVLQNNIWTSVDREILQNSTWVPVSADRI